jgi:zinc transporter ZupT
VTGKALNMVQQMNGAYQGIGLVAIGVMGTFLILDTFSRWQAAVGQPDREQRLKGAWLLGIVTGLRSFAEGLAIGACFDGGAALLGTLLLVCFLVQNFTEGLIAL